jgi:hypothetical protein
LASRGAHSSPARPTVTLDRETLAPKSVAMVAHGGLTLALSPEAAGATRPPARPRAVRLLASAAGVGAELVAGVRAFRMKC